MKTQNIENQESIFNIILKRKEVEKIEEKAAISIDTITAKNFFTDTNPNGAISKAGFLKLVCNQNERELKVLDGFLGKMTESAKIDVTPFESIDKSGRNYVFANIRLKNGTQGYKILTAENLCQFIGLYQFGLFKCDISLDSLYKEAIAKV